MSNNEIRLPSSLELLRSKRRYVAPASRAHRDRKKQARKTACRKPVSSLEKGR